MSAAFATVLQPDLSLARTERDIPRPRRGEALIRLRATSLNYHDVLRLGGGYPDLPLPCVPFSDGCGDVVAVGEEVTRVAVGDRVMPNFFPLWSGGPESAYGRSVVYGDHIDGTLQSHLCADALALVRAPSHLDDLEAATLGCAGVTAWRSVVALGGARPGQWVVVEGTGGVALFALAFARMSGARVCVTSSSDEKLDRARELGADATINYRSHPDWAKEVLELTDGRGADHVVDIGGPDTLPLAIKAAAIGGRVSIIGARSGIGREPPFPIRTVMKKNLTLRGLSVGSRTDFEDMCAAISSSGYRPVIGATLPYADVEKAVELMESQQHVGKIALAIDERG